MPRAHGIMRRLHRRGVARVNQGDRNVVTRVMRRFSDVEIDESAARPDDWMASAIKKFGRRREWKELLKYRRILIISEAGAGKTFECQQQQKLLWADGEAAFFVELSQLSMNKLDDLLSPEEYARLVKWQESRTEIATFFLDSIDELSLTQGTFRQALISLAKGVQGFLHRIRVVITSRPVPIDEHLAYKYLPAYGDNSLPAAMQSFSDIVIHGAAHAMEEAGYWCRVELDSLTLKQARALIVQQHINDPDALLAAIENANADDFAKRPQDLLEICSHWRENQALGKLQEQIHESVKFKLNPTELRQEVAELSPKRAREGSARLALAALLARRLNFKYSTDASNGSNTALDVAQVLVDWTKAERDALLQRGIFGFASYGLVRFHHLSVAQFLAAERLNSLLDQGRPFRDVKRLLFSTTTAGLKIVKPSLRPVAAWLGLKNDRVFDSVLKCDPSVMLIYGDPASLSLSQKKSALHAYVHYYAAEAYRGLAIPTLQARRLADPKLHSTVSALWLQATEDKKVRYLLLDLIALARMSECTDIPMKLALDAGADDDERSKAISTLGALSDADLSPLVQDINDTPQRWPDKLAFHLVPVVFPRFLPLSGLFPILRRLRNSRGEGPVRNLASILVTVDLSGEVLNELCNWLINRIRETATWQAPGGLNTEDASLVTSLCSLCSRLLDNGEASQETLQACVLAAQLRIIDLDKNDFPGRLRAQLSALRGEPRQTLFWADEALRAQFFSPADAKEQYDNTQKHGVLRLDYAVDFEWVITALADASVPASKREFLLQAALHLSAEQPEDQHCYDTILSSLAGNSQLVSVARNFTTPVVEQAVAPTAQLRRSKRSERANPKIHLWEAFRKRVMDDPTTAFSDEQAERTLRKLWLAGPRHTFIRFRAQWDIERVVAHLGVNARVPLEEALSRAWRTTTKASGDLVTNNSELTETLRLAALIFNASQPGWADTLTALEVQQALRLIGLRAPTLERLLPALYEKHRSAVEREANEQLSLAGSEATPLLERLGSMGVSLSTYMQSALSQWLEAQIKAADRTGVSDRLIAVANILAQSGDVQTRDELKLQAKQNIFGKEADLSMRLWGPVLFRTDPLSGVKCLEEILKDAPVANMGRGVEWFALSFADLSQRNHAPFLFASMTPQVLLDLVRLAHRHVDKKFDKSRGLSGQNDVRRQAENVRNRFLHELLKQEGAAAWEAKLELLADPVFADARERVKEIIFERAALESEGRALSMRAIQQIEASGNFAPLTREQMFMLLDDRVEDLRSMLLEDTSPRRAWSIVEDENTLRQVIARELNHAAKGAYTVDQESVTADGKETDIRMRSTASEQQAVIELKLGDKPRSANELLSALHDQLLDKYMAAEQTRSGCLLITFAGKRTWRHPHTHKELDFEGLIAFLEDAAQQINNAHSGEIQVMVRGLDLRPRLAVEGA